METWQKWGLGLTFAYLAIAVSIIGGAEQEYCSFHPTFAIVGAVFWNWAAAAGISYHMHAESLARSAQKDAKELVAMLKANNLPVPLHYQHYEYIA